MGSQAHGKSTPPRAPPRDLNENVATQSGGKYDDSDRLRFRPGHAGLPAKPSLRSDDGHNELILPIEGGWAVAHKIDPPITAKGFG
jgi:hypothetical protein